MSGLARWPVPKNWGWTAIGMVAEVTGGGTPPANDPTNFAERDGIPWITPADLTGYEEPYIGKGRRNLSEKGYAKSAAKLLPVGAVLFTSRAPIGYCAIAANPISTNQGFKSLTLFGGISSEFTRHYLKWSKSFLESLASGTTFLELSGSKLEQAPFPLSPVAEQKRIVAKLDALNAKSARARTELARIETLVSRYKRAVLSKAFSGELTAEWRNERKGLITWRELSLDQLVSDGPTNGWSPKADGASSGLKSLKLSATSSGRLRLDAETIKYLDQNIPDNSKFWLRPNDILIQRANSLELLGTTVLFDGPPREFIFPDLMMRIRARDAVVTPVYLATYLNSDPARTYFRANATGTAGNMPKINGSTVRGTSVPTPPLEEQHEIVRRIESAFARIDRLAAQAKRALDLVGKLDEAILGKAFRGELVPQDENDEPAEKLLERIRAERAAAPKAKRGRGRKV